MKIALITYNADPARGGAERYTVDLARALAGRGYDVALLHATSATGEKFPGVTYIHAKAGGLSRAGRHGNFLHAIDRRLEAEHFDIVHAMLPVHRCDIYQPHAGFAFEAFASAHLTRKSGLAHRMSRLGNRLNPKRRLYADVEHNLLTSIPAPTVICLSKTMKREAVSHFHFDPENLTVIPNAVDLKRYDPAAHPQAGTEFRAKFGIMPAKKIGLFLGQDFVRKGLAETLHAMAGLNDPSFVLLVAGRDDPAPFKRLAGTLGVSQNVIFAGATGDPYPFYAAADVVLFPSRFDPFGLVPAEAVAMGVPPIVSSHAGVSELLDHDHNALIVEEPSQIGSLAAAMRYALEPATHERLARGCMKTRVEFSYEKHLNAVIDLYAARQRRR
ncbi:MAG TPA: glycosyltransferase family 4 protein [Afipia sp.]